MKRICCLAVTLILPFGAPAAQEAPTLAPGSRVRVTSESRRLVGTLQSIDSATIVVRRENGSVVNLERARRTRLDVSAGPGSCGAGRRGGCIALGFLGGAVVGLGVGAIAVSSCEGDLCGLYYLFTLPAGAVVGTIVGAVVGGERWKRAEIPVRLSLVPGGAGQWDTRVGLQLRFDRGISLMTALCAGHRLIAKASARVRPLILVVALQLPACYTEAVHVPAELAPVARLPVKGRYGWSPGQHLRFGEYETERRESQLLQAVIVTVADVVRGEGIEPLGFRLRASGRDLWRAACDPITRHRQGEPASTESNHLRCTLVPAAGDSSRTWRLLVRRPYNEVPRGDLIGPEGTLDVLGTTRDGKGRVRLGDQALGYYVQDSGRTVAAVEVLYEGAVWFHPELAPERRDLLAATAAALLLWDYLVHTPL